MTEIYEWPDEIAPSLYWSVEVNGTNALVFPTSEHHICTFGCDGPVAVKISSRRENIMEAAVLPVSKGYTYKLENDEVTVILAPGDRTVVEINGKEDCDLFIFANPLEDDKPSTDDPDVRYFRAGTVTEASSIGLSSGQTVYIEGGAVVKGVLASVPGSSDVSVRGCGILDARGNAARGIQFHKIRNLLIENITLINDINWSAFIAEGVDVTISNFKVVAVENPQNSTGCENDALDLLGCRNAVVKGCFGYAHDDVFCVKAQKWSYCGEVSNILFDDCIAWNYLSGNSLVIGAETNQTVTGVTYRNSCSIHSGGRPSTLYRGGLSVHHCAGGDMSDILFENIVLEDCKEFGIHIDIRKSYVKDLGTGVEYSPGTLDGIVLRNVSLLKKPACGNAVFGYDDGEHRIRNLVFDNVVQEGVLFTADNLPSFFTRLDNVEYSVE